MEWMRKLSWFELLIGLVAVGALLLVLLRPFRLINIGNITINRLRDANQPGDGTPV